VRMRPAATENPLQSQRGPEGGIFLLHGILRE
jgi:hypothetical protein